jgi:uncharacterized protein
MSVDTVDEKRALILAAMRERGRILVAFSGGVDSGLVLRLAHDAVGEQCLAVIADSPSLPRRELEAARKVAGEIGAPLRVLRLREMEREDYLENSGLRCYFCRTELGRELKELAASEGFDTIADGANASDLGDYRPGMKASDENGFWHPLIEFGVTKEMIRTMAKGLSLSWHDKPSSPCLSSRIMTGERITEKKLRMIEAGEDLLHDMGYRLVRVRNVNGDARIEVPREDMRRLTETSTFTEVEKRLCELGFLSVTADPQGYRQGSMNRRI